MIKNPFCWLLARILIVNSTFWMWVIIAQPTRYHVPLFWESLIVIFTGMYALWIFCYRNNDGKLRQALGTKHMNSLIVLQSFLLTLVFIECGSRMILDISDSNTPGAIQQNWYAGHWFGNSLGYRDVEPAPANLINVLVVGDSFVAGYGIADISQMIGAQLQAQLGSDYGVNIAAEPGDNTFDEFHHLMSYPVQPDIVVWSHHVNDIADYHDLVIISPQLIFDVLLGKTYITDFLYYHVLHHGRIETPSALEYQYHLELLDTLYQWCQEHGIQFVFVNWDYPTMNLSAPILQWSQSRGIETLDAMLLYNGDITDYASALDAHPSPRLIALEAERLSRMIYEACRTANDLVPSLVVGQQ